MKKIGIVIFVGLMIFAQSEKLFANSGVPIKITAGNTVITGILNDTDTAQDLIAALPLTLTMTRYSDLEYYGKPQPPFSKNTATQRGYTDGDIAYYTPGDSLALYFAKGEGSTMGGLIIIGRITSDLQVFNSFGNSIEMRFERAE